MATRGQQKQKKLNVQLSKKELTELEKEAERRSEQRRKNRRAGNAGLSSQRLNRLEAEAERKSAERREANKPTQKAKTTPPEGTRRAAVAERRALTGSGANLRATDPIVPKDIKGKGTMSQIKRMASKLTPAARVGARFLGPLGVIYTAYELLDMLPDSAKKSQAGQAEGIKGGRSNAARKKKEASQRKGRGDGASEVAQRKADTETKSKKTAEAQKSTNNKSSSTTKGSASNTDVTSAPRTISEAKRRGMDYFVDKSGNRKAAVTKEELEASGLSLRDYLNKQQGKTRKMSTGGMPKRVNCGASMKPTQKSSQRIK